MKHGMCTYSLPNYKSFMLEFSMIKCILRNSSTESVFHLSIANSSWTAPSASSSLIIGSAPRTYFTFKLGNPRAASLLMNAEKYLKSVFCIDKNLHDQTLWRFWVFLLLINHKMRASSISKYDLKFKDLHLSIIWLTSKIYWIKLYL